MGKHINNPHGQRMPSGNRLRILTLKCWPTSFLQSWNGQKTWELRKNDREYQVGDLLMLSEFVPTEHETENPFKSGTPGHLTGRWVRQRVLKVTPLEMVHSWFPDIPIPEPGYVLLSVQNEDRGQVAQKDMAQLSLDLGGMA